MLKTVNTEFSFIEIWFTDQDNRPLEIEDSVNISLIIGIGKYMISSKNVKKLMDGSTKTSKNFVKVAGKKIIHKTAEATGDLVGNEIADKITSIGKPRSKKEKDETNIMEETQEIYIPPEKRRQIIKDLKLF